MSLLRIFQDEFRRNIRATLTDIKKDRERNKKRFELDRKRIINELIHPIEPHPIDHKYVNDNGESSDFYVAGVDGSGVYPLVTLEDIDIIVESFYASIHYTDTESGNLFRTVLPYNETGWEKLEAISYLGIKWITQDDGEPIRFLREHLIEHYPIYDQNSRINDPNDKQIQVIFNNYYEDINPYYPIDHLPRYDENKLVDGITVSASTLYSIAMRIGELGLAKQIIVNGHNLKYLLIDGSLSFKYDPHTMLPTDIIGYLLRDLLKTAREHNVIVMAVSKTHSIPFSNEAIQIAREIYGNNHRWYLRLPGGIPKEQGLSILENRRYIPPPLTVPYLVQLDQQKPTLRVDFDALWWHENIYDDDINILHEKEHQIFQDLDFMSRAIYWVGYPVPLAVAHNKCKIPIDTEKVLYSIVKEIAIELGFDRNLFLNQRELIHII